MGGSWSRLTDTLEQCLLHLGLGHSSVLFHYNRQRNTFYPVKEGLRLSGFSAGMVARWDE